MKKTDTDEKKTMRTRRFTRIDLAAAVVFFCVFAAAFFSLRYKIGHNDESFYYTVVQRFLAGDRPLIDEWHVSQISAFLLLIPYRLAFAICGGSAQGIVLTLRYLFWAYRAAFAVWLWGRFRTRGVPGLIGETLYFLFTYMNLPTFGYSTIAMDGVLFFAALLFLGEPPGTARLFAAGVAAGIVVLAEPVIAAAWPLYCLAAGLHAVFKKKDRSPFTAYGTILGGRGWLAVTGGMLLVGVPLLVFLLVRCGAREVLQALPELLSDSEYRTVREAGAFGALLAEKMWAFLQALGRSGAILIAVTGLGCLLYRPLIRARTARKTVKYALLALTCALMLSVNLRMISQFGRSESFLHYGFAPFQLFPLFFFLLCEKKDPAAFGFYVAGTLLSGSMDLGSQLMFGVGGAVSQVCGCFAAAQVFAELREDLRETVSQAHPEAGEAIRPTVFLRICAADWKAAAETGKKKRAKKKKAPKRAERFKTPLLCSCGAGAAILAAVLLAGGVLSWEAVWLSRVSLYPQLERTRIPEALYEPLDRTVDAGPQKGIRTTETVKTAYEAAIADIDAIRSFTDGPIYVFANCPALYLQTGTPYACYSTWFVRDDFDRQLRYWELHPERGPAYIYLPDVTFHNFLPEEEETLAERTEAVLAHFEAEPERGRGGVIFRIIGSRPDQD